MRVDIHSRTQWRVELHTERPELSELLPRVGNRRNMRTYEGGSLQVGRSSPRDVYSLPGFSYASEYTTS